MWSSNISPNSKKARFVIALDIKDLWSAVTPNNRDPWYSKRRLSPLHRTQAPLCFDVGYMILELIPAIALVG